MQRRHSSRCRRSRGLTQCRPDSFPEVACATEGRIAGKKARTAITSSGAITPVMPRYGGPFFGRKLSDLARLWHREARDVWLETTLPVASSDGRK